MNLELDQKKRQLQELLQRIPVSGSYESVDLTRQVAQLTAEIEKQERIEREALFSRYNNPDIVSPG